jgi:hypothetical protein
VNIHTQEHLLVMEEVGKIDGEIAKKQAEIAELIAKRNRIIAIHAPSDTVLLGLS